MEVLNVRVTHLRGKGYDSLQSWLDADPERHMYIGRNMPYVSGANGSKWQNPFPVKKYGIDASLEEYERAVRSDRTLMSCLPELRGKVLGCWCVPQSRCHGQVLQRLLLEMDQQTSE